jgi:hypothetical protein
MRNIRSGRKTHRFSTISSSRMRLYGRVCPFNGFPIADCTSSNSMHFCCTFMQSNLVLNHAADRPSENKLVFFFSSMSIAPSDIVPCRACDRSESKEYSIQRLLLGTHTSPGEPNHLMIAEVRLPTEETAIDPRKYDDQRGGASFSHLILDSQPSFCHSPICRHFRKCKKLLGRRAVRARASSRFQIFYRKRLVLTRSGHHRARRFCCWSR